MRPLLIVLAFVLAACTGGPTIGRAPGIEPLASSEAVVRAALDRIKQMENAAGTVLAPARIVSAVAMTGDEAHDSVGWGPDGLDFATVWLVQAEGTFTPVVAGEPPGWVRPTATAGWIIVRDVDAVVIGSGWP